MSTQKWIPIGVVTLSLVLALSAAAQKVQYSARSGSKIRLEGTSNIHDWQVEGSLIGGSLQAGPNFPTEPGQQVKPGKLDAEANAFIMVRGLHSIEKDGRPYSDAMDDRMYQAMRADQNRQITFHLTELTLKEPAKSKEAPYECEAKGDVALAGVTNAVTMPVKIQPLADKKLKVSGSTTLKMTSFKIEPPAPKIALGMIKTGDDVKVIFDWMLAQKAPTTAAAK
jgi:YceI-like domain